MDRKAALRSCNERAAGWSRACAAVVWPRSSAASPLKVSMVAFPRAQLEGNPGDALNLLARDAFARGFDRAFALPLGVLRDGYIEIALVHLGGRIGGGINARNDHFLRVLA